MDNKDIILQKKYTELKRLKEASYEVRNELLTKIDNGSYEPIVLELRNKVNDLSKEERSSTEVLTNLHRNIISKYKGLIKQQHKNNAKMLSEEFANIRSNIYN